MKDACLTGLAIAALFTAGCASAPRIVSLDQVGPNPSAVPMNGQDGFLEVYSAREGVLVNVNGEVFAWNSDFGRNEFLHGTAHTDYSIYGADGRLVERVRNSAGMNDSNPAMVRLAPGVYRVEAESEDYNDVTLPVVMPVSIRPGMRTAVHLDGQWNPGARARDYELVRLPDGRFVGWRSRDARNANFASENGS